MNKNALDSKRIISQCYDGAPVMNGYKTGVAKRLQDELRKEIPYVHCFNHRFHLVIVHTVQQIPEVKQFFDQLQLIYTMLRKPKIKKLYEGGYVKRLLDTRWTGHFKSAKSTLKNYKAVVETLGQVENSLNEIDGDDRAICIGIKSVITKKDFVFTLIFINEILSVIAPADTIFQKQEIGYKRALPVVDAVQASIREYRNDKKFEEFVKKTEDFMTDNISFISYSRPVRQNRQRSKLLQSFIVEETLGERSAEEDNMKSIYYRIIDVTLSEFKERFSENNRILLALSNSENFELSEIKDLENVGIQLPSQCELHTAKKYVATKRSEHEKLVADRNSQKDKKLPELPRFNLLGTLYEVREAFPDVYNMFAGIETFVCGTSTCEATFSSLSRIDIPSRMTMTNKRMRNLTFLAFENQRLAKIPLDDVLHKFNDQKGRRMQIF